MAQLYESITTHTERLEIDLLRNNKCAEQKYAAALTAPAPVEVA